MSAPRDPLPGALRAAGVLLAVPLVLPLVVHPSFLFPYVAPKVHLFRLAALAALGCMAWEAIRRASAPLRWPTWIALAAGAFLASAGISAAAGVDPARSLWDSPDRMMGFYTLLCAGAWYAAAAVALPRRGDWLPLLRIAVVAGAIAGLFGAAQAILAVRSDDPGVLRPGGTLGHGAFLGTAGVSTAFLAVLLRALSPARPDRILSLAGAGAGVAGVLAGQSRAALLALAVGGTVLLVARAAIAPPGARERRLCAGVLLAGLVAAGGLFLLRDAPAVRALPGIGRLATMRLDEETVRTRSASFEAAFAASGRSPWLGWGPRNFLYASDAFYRPGLHHRDPSERWIDYAHCAPLDVVAEQGIPGMTLWFCVYGAALLAAWSARQRGLVDGPTAAAATAYLAARLTGNLLLFEDPSSLVHTVLFLALLARLSTPDATEAAPEGSPTVPAARAAAAAATVALLALLAWNGDVRPMRAGLELRGAVEDVVRGDSGAGGRMERAFEGGIAGAGGYRVYFGSRVCDAVARPGDRVAAEAAGRAAFDELGRAEREHPRDVRPALLRWSLMERLPGLRADRSAVVAACEGLEAAARVAPRRPDVQLLLSDARLASGNVLGAMIPALHVMNLDPSLGGGWVRMAAAQAAGGSRDEARRTIEKAAAGGAIFSADDAARVLALGLKTR